MSDYHYPILLTIGYVILVFSVPIVVIFLLERFYRAPIDPQDEELPLTDLGPQSAIPSSEYRVEAQARAAAKELDNVYETNPPCPEFLARQEAEAQAYYESQTSGTFPGEPDPDHPVDYRYVDARKFSEGLIFLGEPYTTPGSRMGAAVPYVPLAYDATYVGPISIPDAQINPSDAPNPSPTAQEPQDRPTAS